MIKIILTKKTNVIFLAIVLIAGTFAAISPSFMIGAHAQQYGMDQKYNNYEQDYGMDSYNDKQSYGKDSNSYYKSKDSNVKCNNINANLNGFNGVDINALPTALRGLATEAQASADEGEIGASSSGSDEGGRTSGSDSDSRFVCIDNNDFTVVEEEEPTCEDCFTKVITEEEKLDDLIQAFEEESDGVISSLEDLCDFIDSGDLDETDFAFISDRLFVLGGDVGISEDKINEILDCLEELLNVDFPREIIEPLTAQQQMNWKSLGKWLVVPNEYILSFFYLRILLNIEIVYIWLKYPFIYLLSTKISDYLSF